MWQYYSKKVIIESHSSVSLWCPGTEALSNKTRTAHGTGWPMPPESMSTSLVSMSLCLSASDSGVCDSWVRGSGVRDCESVMILIVLADYQNNEVNQALWCPSILYCDKQGEKSSKCLKRTLSCPCQHSCSRGRWLWFICMPLVLFATMWLQIP